MLEIVEGGQNAWTAPTSRSGTRPPCLGWRTSPARADPAAAPDARFPLFRKTFAGVPGDWEDSPQAWYERPIFYHPSRFSVCGPDAEVPWPAYCEKLDFELEFGCYIGKPGKDILKERAREHIFGYTIFNDFSARDEQAKEMAGQLGPGKGKDFDNANAMGPCLVTADELGDPYRLEMVVRVNGEEWGRGNSRDMHWKFEDCIAHASRSETLHSGEFFGSGTVGNGCGLEQPALPQARRRRRAGSRSALRHRSATARLYESRDRHRGRQAGQHRLRSRAAAVEGRHAGRRRRSLRGRLSGLKKCFCVRCDVSDPASAEQAIQKAIEKFNRLDVLVNCVGGSWGPRRTCSPHRRSGSAASPTARSTIGARSSPPTSDSVFYCSRARRRT